MLGQPWWTGLEYQRTQELSQSHWVGPGRSQRDHQYPLHRFKTTTTTILCLWFFVSHSCSVWWGDFTDPRHFYGCAGEATISICFQKEPSGSLKRRRSDVFYLQGMKEGLLPCRDWNGWGDSWLELLYLICCAARTSTLGPVVYRVLWNNCICSSVYSQGIVGMLVFGVINGVLTVCRWACLSRNYIHHRKPDYNHKLHVIV